MSKASRKGRPLGHRQQSSTSTLSIGNCQVDVPDSASYTLDADGLSIDASDYSTISIKVAHEGPIVSCGSSFTLVNPKILDGAGKLLLQDVLKLYSKQLPAMNYAANTGKESQFLESCVFSGKYRTLILRDVQLGLIGAVTYQILPGEAHQAEIPLAAVIQAHQRKGFGSYLYKELRRRLLDVGLTSIYCWGDQESEAFWAKQGFVPVAEVDGRGKPSKLPIKAEVRKAMSMPGSATLMTASLSSISILPASSPPAPVCPAPAGKVFGKSSMESTPPKLISSAQTVESGAGKNLSPCLSIITPQVVGEIKSSQAPAITGTNVVAGGQNSNGSVTPLNMEGMLSSVASEKPLANVSKPARPKAARLPFSNVTNNEPVASGPLKKHPNARKGLASKKFPNPDVPLPTFAPDSALDDTEQQTAHGDVDENCPSDLAKASTSGQKDGSKLGAGVQVQDSVRNKAIGEPQGSAMVLTDSTTNRQELVSKSAKCKANAGVKRARDDDLKFGRRTARRRKGDPLPIVAKQADGIEIQTNQARKQTANDLVPKSVNSKTCTGVKRGTDTREEPAKLGRPTASRRRGDPLPNEARQADIRDFQTGQGLEKTVNAKQKDGKSLAVNAVSPQPEDEGRGIKAVEQPAKLDPFAGILTRPSSHTSSLDVVNTIDRPLDLSTVPDSNGMEPNSSGVKLSHVVEPTKSPVEMFSDGQASLSSGKERHVVMFTNMADENQKKKLTKHVEQLKGMVTCDGCQCTHVLTGEVRRTLNFCVAISSGAWILSPEWLKISVKQKKFAEEKCFILKDRRFESKYNVSLEDVISRARQRPNLLLDGLHIFPTAHVHPPVDTIHQIVKAAGGKILQNMAEVEQLEDKSCAAAITCEEDKTEAMLAAKAGLKTFSSDWLLTCIVKQELDLAAPQFI